jgi:hypothetical protein
MLAAAGLIDVLIPRGGKALVARVQADARVPVLAHLDGNNHVYVDATADPEMAREIVLNAKLRRTGVCGAMETLLVDRSFAEPAALLSALADAGCALRGDAGARAIEPRAQPVTDADWDTEYLEAIAAVGVVDGMTARSPTSPRTARATPTRSSPPTRSQPSVSWRRSTPRSCCGTPRPSSPTAASSGWAPRSASPPAASTRADRSHSKASPPTNGWAAAPARCGLEGLVRADSLRHEQARPRHRRTGRGNPRAARPGRPGKRPHKGRVRR